MEEATEVDVEVRIAADLCSQHGKKNLECEVKRKSTQGRQKKVQAVSVDGDNLQVSEEVWNHGLPRITVSEFDYSIENHFRAMDTIGKLCRDDECSDFYKNEIERLSSSVTFVREWSYFTYQPRIVRFACQSEGLQGKDVIGEMLLPHFSAAAVPKKQEAGNTTSPEIGKDFVMHVGGPVWALDWCPRVHQKSDYNIKCEYIAIAAHPPESCYHKIGATLTGRGVIQVWCLLNVDVKAEEVPPQVKQRPKQHTRSSEAIKGKLNQPKKPRGRPRKKPLDEPIQTKKPRGRPRKKPVDESVDNLDCSNQNVQPLSIQVPKDSSGSHPGEGASTDISENVAKKYSGRKRKGFGGIVSAEDSVLTISVDGELEDTARKGSGIHGNGLTSITQNENNEPSHVDPKTCSRCGHDSVESGDNAGKSCSLETGLVSDPVLKDVALPRMVLCMYHNGKVAWDVKWRPSIGNDANSKHRMGYLAVLLGNGALEVWEVPFPRTVKSIYSARQKGGDDSDPRFLKLEPVFRCSRLKCGDRQSIPLTVEWSASFPHDFILAGCHDGVVALWKFSATDPSKDTRPLLCFSADTVPIRALAWAPVDSDPVAANIIVTAGHKGLKFWDLRDPFRPLWDLNPVQRVIYSLDWLPDPRCVIVSFDDGTLRILSLVKAACDVPVTGKSFVGTQQQGFNSYYCSSFTIWSVQVSRLTGMVAYCGADGTILRFQLTKRAVEKDPLRNRAPHFLCGALIEEESTLTVINPLPDTPFPMKKSLNEWSNAPRSIRGFLSVSNQAKRAQEKMAKGQTSDDQSLVVHYNDDLETEFITKDVSLSRKSQQTPSRMGTMKKPETNLALVCIDEESENEEPENVQREDCVKGEAGKEIDKFPPKIIAMHKVRWNMNRGSERWLCSGGAAGIVRCQEIDM